MELPSIITDQERAKAALHKAAGGLDRLGKFYLMSGVAWAISELRAGTQTPLPPELRARRPFRLGRLIIHRLA